jgi:hypothetical protein
LDDRIAKLGRVGSWPEIIADLDSLTETEVEQASKRFVIRASPREGGAPTPHASKTSMVRSTIIGAEVVEGGGLTFCVTFFASRAAVDFQSRRGDAP